MHGNRRRQSTASPALPPGAQQPTVLFPSPSSNYEVTSAQECNNNWENPWTTTALMPDNLSPTHIYERPRVHSMQDAFRGEAPQHLSFPEPIIYRSPSQGAIVTSQRLGHHYSRSDVGSSTSISNPHQYSPSSSSTYSFSSNESDIRYYTGSTPNDDRPGDLVRGLSDLSLTSEELLRCFQAGELKESDQEWHRLVPPQAKDSLDKEEVQRQSVIFELIKSEREYVADLEAVQQVFVDGLRAANPPIINGSDLPSFIEEVFSNLHQILSYHRRILASLFERQRDQHPLIQSVADIILDTTLKADFRSAYEIYIKHYPLAASHHQKQLKKNRAYEVFVHSASNDPRIRRRDINTFLSRPVTRLPRLSLILDQILKLTQVGYEHPDLETLPIILGILNDCIKSTQPGIEAAEAKVKFWGLCDSLSIDRGQIIEMDLYTESRTLVQTGPVLRRIRTDAGLSEKWREYVAALLDNYFLITQEQKRSNGSIRRLLKEPPLPLSFLRLGSFTSPPEMRREKAEDGNLLETLRGQLVPLYPFTIYHASSRSARRYTFYVATEAIRKKWYGTFVNAIGMHKIRQDANMWFNPQNLTDGFFRTGGKETTVHSPIAKLTGKIICAVPFAINSYRFLAVGCGHEIYAGRAHSEHFQSVFHCKNLVSLAALTNLGDKVFNRFIVHADSSIMSYSLDILARLANGQVQPQTLEASVERIGGNDTNIVFLKYVHVGGKALLIYSSKRRLGTSVSLQALEAIETSKLTLAPKRSGAQIVRTFRPYGEAGYLPRDAHDVVAVSNRVGVITNGGIVTTDPANFAESDIGFMPDFKDASNNINMSELKTHFERLKPLGFVRVSPLELLIIYDEIGCYVDKRGVPTRNCRYIRWEVKAVSYAERNGHILLISPEFIEVRNITTGGLAQVIEGQDIRLLYSGPYMTKADPVLVAMRGGKDDHEGVSEKIVELLQTEEFSPISPSTSTAPVHWEEWDM